VDILINRLSIELDYNVLNAVRGSLEKIKNENLKYVIDKLLAIERNFFVQEYALEIWRNDAETAFKESKEKFADKEYLFKKSKSEVDKRMFDNLKEEMDTNWNTYINRKKDYNELFMHKQVIADFLSNFLGITQSYPIMGLVFFRNSMNYIVVTEINLTKSEFKHSAFIKSQILETKFDESNIINTVFTSSNLTKSSFLNCRINTSLFDRTNLKNVNFSGTEFREVFFAGADLSGSIFNDTKGLKPIYFYKAKNLDKAILNPMFKKEINKELVNITDSLFIESVNKSDLTEERKKYFLNSFSIILLEGNRGNY
jgi:uncharacterized protein YjbI with pentapeptide repeats